MKLKIFQEEAIKAIPILQSEPEITLRLINSGNGVLLCSVNEKGIIIQGGVILEILDNGTLKIWKQCQVQGLQFNINNQIRIVD